MSRSRTRHCFLVFVVSGYIQTFTPKRQSAHHCHRNTSITTHHAFPSDTSGPENAPKNGAIHPLKRYTFANIVGPSAIHSPPVCSKSRLPHPIKSAFYTILLRFSWDIGAKRRNPGETPTAVGGMCNHRAQIPVRVRTGYEFLMLFSAS